MEHAMKSTDISYIITPQMRGKQERGTYAAPLRLGDVVENNDTKRLDIAGWPAVVTHEKDGWATLYVYGRAKKDHKYPGCLIWFGPFTVKSEEVITKE